MRVAMWSFSFLFLAGSAQAQAVNLVETPRAKDCTRVQIATKVDGERIYVQDGEKKTHKFTLVGSHQFHERLMALHAGSGLTAKTARRYLTAQTDFTLNGATTRQSLPADRALVVALRGDDGHCAYSLGGQLPREQYELIAEHFDTLCLAGLLPGKEVQVGDTWKLANAAVIGLCQFEGLVSHELTGKLTAVKNDRAEIEVTGVAQGIDAGAQVALNVTAKATFDVKQSRVIAVDWKQEDLRDEGPVSPRFKANVTVSLRREAIDEPKELSDATLAAVSTGLEAPSSLTAIVYRDPAGRFELHHPRDWRLTGATDKHATFRLVERGDFVAQATITMWDKAAPGQHQDPKDFKEAMLASPGWQAEQVLQENVIQVARPGRFVYRLAVQGTIDELKVVQTFFLVAGPNGDQAVVAFTTRQQQVAKFGARDLAFVETLDFQISK